MIAQRIIERGWLRSTQMPLGGSSQTPEDVRYDYGQKREILALRKLSAHLNWIAVPFFPKLKFEAGDLASQNSFYKRGMAGFV